MEKVSGPIRIGIRIEDLVESGITLVAVKKLDEFFYGDVRLCTEPINTISAVKFLIPIQEPPSSFPSYNTYNSSKIRSTSCLPVNFL